MVRDLVWPQAETVVWLDYALPVILGRLTRRTLRRLITEETLWQGNRESWWVTLFTRDSRFVWVMQTYRRHRRDYPRIAAQPEHACLTLVRLRSPGATEEWLAGLGGPIFPSAERPKTSTPVNRRESATHASEDRGRH